MSHLHLHPFASSLIFHISIFFIFVSLFVPSLFLYFLTIPFFVHILCVGHVHDLLPPLFPERDGLGDVRREDKTDPSTLFYPFC
jgi:hypothetical protein